MEPFAAAASAASAARARFAAGRRAVGVALEQRGDRLGAADAGAAGGDDVVVRAQHVGVGLGAARHQLHLRVELAQLLDRRLGAALLAGVGGGDAELAAGADVGGRHVAAVLHAHVADAREHEVLRHLVHQPVDADEEDARAEEAALGVEAPEADLAVVPLDVDVVLGHCDTEREREEAARGQPSGPKVPV